MTIHIDAPETGTKERPNSHDSDDSTPQTTPRATPKPGLRASVRALSRQSGLKPNTLVFRSSDRSQFTNLIRSQRPNEKERISVRTDQSANMVETNIVTGFSDSKLRRSRDSECSAEMDLPVNRQELEDDRGLGDSLEPISLDSEIPSKFEFAKFQPSNPQRQGHEKLSVDYDPYLMRDTPLSISSAISIDSRNGVFFESSDNFYYVCPYIGDEQNPTWTNYELFHLVEECFQKKVSAKYILRIIYSRRKYDGRAREFLKSSAVDLIERIKFEAAQEEVPMCVSS